MSTEANNANNTEVEAPEVTLPSDSAEKEVNPYDLSSFKDEDGKLAGKFETAEDLMKSYNEAQEYIQKINAERAREGNEKAKAEKTQEQEQRLATVEDRLMTEFANGDVDAELVAEAKEAGFSDEKIELIKYKSQESMKKIVDEVGSVEKFDEIINTLSEHLSDDEKKTFNSMAKDKLTSEIAILGLKAKYDSIVGNTGNNDRIRGEANVGSAKGYSTQQEMMADLAVLRQNPNNAALQVAYQNKMRNTPDDVVYGRR